MSDMLDENGRKEGGTYDTGVVNEVVNTSVSYDLGDFRRALAHGLAGVHSQGHDMNPTARFARNILERGGALALGVSTCGDDGIRR